MMMRHMTAAHKYSLVLHSLPAHTAEMEQAVTIPQPLDLLLVDNLTAPEHDTQAESEAGR